MKKILVLLITIIGLSSCEKEAEKVDLYTVEDFIVELKNGTYNSFTYDENGEKLWSLMPQLSQDDIPTLLNAATDTSFVSPCNHFPVNPISSIPPYRIQNGVSGIILSEYLLWCAEGLIRYVDFVSLTPILVNVNTHTEKRLTGKELLQVQALYMSWWEANKTLEGPSNMPLDGTGYLWR